MAENSKRTFFGGAAVLMLGSILVKIIGAVYKIPLGNILGEEGNGYFMAAYEIFNVIMTVATTGLPVAISKFIAEADALGRRNQVQRIFRVTLITMATLGGVGFLIMSVGAGPITAKMGSSGARMAVLALSPCVLFLCTATAFRGYAQGHGNMVPTSVSQVLESIFKLVVGLGLAAYIASLTFSAPEQRLQMAAAGAIIGVSTGSLVSLVYLFLWYARSHKKGESSRDVPDTGKTVLGRLLKVAVPITIGASAISIVSLIDTTQVLGYLGEMFRGQGMEPAAAETAATTLYGTYKGCMNLYNLPSALMVPFTASIIPAVSAALTRRNRKEAKRLSESALRISAILALPMGVGLCALGEPVVRLLYPKWENLAIGGTIMSILGAASIFVCVMLLCNSILQANGFVNIPVLTTVIGGVIKVVLNYLLILNSEINVLGAAISTLACFAVTAILDVIIILRVVPSPPNFIRAFAKPLIASLIMGVGAWAVCGLTSNFLGIRVGCIAGILVGGLVYLFLVIFLRVFSKDDLELMPKGDKIARILKIQ